VAGLLVLAGVLTYFLWPTAANKGQPQPPRVWLTEKQKSAAADAIKALGRVEAAVQVGVNFQQYSQLVIDAKAVVNEAERTLPAGEMRNNLTEATDAYKDAATVWDHKIQFPSLGLMKDLGDGEIISRYKLPLAPDPTDNKLQANPNLAMQVIWAVGAKKLATARSLQ